MTWAIVATILGLGAMSQAEFWAREWHDKKRRRRAAEKRLARIKAKQEERERVRMRLEIAEEVKDAHARRAAAIAAGDVKGAARAVSDAHDIMNTAMGAGGHGQSWLNGAQQGADVGTAPYSDVGTCAYEPFAIRAAAAQLQNTRVTIHTQTSAAERANAAAAAAGRPCICNSGPLHTSSKVVFECVCADWPR